MTLRPPIMKCEMPAETLKLIRKLSANAGFTLLELMVTMALTGLLVVVVYTSLNICLKARERGQATIELLQELRVGQRILTRSLCSAVPSSVGTRVYFQGDSRQMRFFTLMPLEAHSIGGIYHWRVLQGKDEAGRGVLAVEQTKNINWRRDPEGVELRQIIISNLSSLQFSYGNNQESKEIWDSSIEGRLPDWVKVHLTLKDLEPIVLIIPLHMAETMANQRKLHPEETPHQ